MNNKTIGFIGGGRVTRILIKALSNFNNLPENIIVSDPSDEILAKLKTEFPQISITNRNTEAAVQDYVFISLHPPVMAEVLNEIKTVIKNDSIIISLAPKFSIGKISSLLDGNRKVVRMIPNAPTVINNGYNPVAYSENITFAERNELINFFSALGECPEVEEKKVEAYAILCAMGPTYFWFQLNELKKLTMSFGLTDEEAKEGIQKMISGALDTMFNSGLSFEEVVDLVPVKPLADVENEIKEMYRQRLTAINERIAAI